MKVAFQGERGAYSEMACYDFFGSEVDLLPLLTLDNVFQAISEGSAEMGIAPIENTYAGTVTKTYDLLMAHNLFIVGEIHQRIVLCLLAIVAGVAIHAAVMAVAKTERRIATMIRLAMALMILGWAALMTSQLANIAVLNEATVTLVASELMPGWLPSNFSVLVAFQVTVVLFALFLALFSLSHIKFKGSSIWTRIGRRSAPFVFAGYAAAVIAMIIASV